MKAQSIGFYASSEKWHFLFRLLNWGNLSRKSFHFHTERKIANSTFYTNSTKCPHVRQIKIISPPNDAISTRPVQVIVKFGLYFSPSTSPCLLLCSFQPILICVVNNPSESKCLYVFKSFCNSFNPSIRPKRVCTLNSCVITE